MVGGRQIILWWKGDWDCRKLTRATKYVEIFLFYHMRRRIFNLSYWHEECTWNDRQLTRAAEHEEICLFHKVRRNRFVNSYWHGEGVHFVKLFYIFIFFNYFIQYFMHSIMVIAIGISDLNSKPGWSCLHFGKNHVFTCSSHGLGQMIGFFTLGSATSLEEGKLRIHTSFTLHNPGYGREIG